MAVRPKIDLNVQVIPTDQSAGRVNEYVVANGVTLGVQALENTQRPTVVMSHHRALMLQAVAQVQAGVPQGVHLRWISLQSEYHPQVWADRCEAPRLWWRAQW